MPLSINLEPDRQKTAERETNVKSSAGEIGYFLATLAARVRGRRHLFAHRRLAVLVHVALLAVVGAAEGAALIELDEHRVRSVSGAVDVDAVLVVGVA